MSYTYLFVNFDILFQRMGHPDLWKWPPTLTWEDGVCTLRVSARGRVGGQCGQAEPGMMRWDDAMMMWYEYEPGMMSWWYDDKCGMRQVWWGDESSYKTREMLPVAVATKCLHVCTDHCTGSPAATVSSCSLSKFLLSFVEVLGDCFLNQRY